MLGLFKAVMPKEDAFFDLFSAHARTLIDGAEALRDMTEGGDAVEAASARVYRHEEEADDITRQVMLAVRRSFITPFDRSDIQDLTTSLDDAIDCTSSEVLRQPGCGFSGGLASSGVVI